MAYDNLSGIFPLLVDGNLQISAVNQNPVVCVIGTASRGDSESLYAVAGVSQSASDFGRADGSLIRGLYEAVAGGAQNIRLLRIGAKPAILSGFGDSLTVTTNSKDAGAGAEFLIYWDDTALRLRIWRASDDLLVYDNNPVYPSAAIDENIISVTGTAVTGSGDIGTLLAPLTLADADGVSAAVYTAGDDGILLSRMELFEALFVSYKLLENEDLDMILPQNAYVDDSSVTDMTTAEVTALNVGAPWAASSVYPTPGTFFDTLGECFAQEYLGEWHFWWDLDRDGVAEVFPNVGSSSASLDAFGNALDASDFHEANFAYQLADFCFRQSEDNAEMLGTVGMLPPLSWSLKDVSNWVGRVPTLTTDSAGNSVIALGGNGTGLLGNKWMAGRLGVGGTGLPGHTINGIDGMAEGGFIATDSGWPDGSQEKDVNDHLVDIGKYISVVGGQAILSNNSNPTAYAATAANVYGGFVSSLPGNSAPTNKVQPGVRLPFRISVAKLDLLAGAGYVMLQQKPKGIVVSDAPTATRSDSDYKRLTTMRIVKASIDGVRAAGEPYIGEPITGTRLAALETAIQQILVKLQKAEFLNRFEVAVTSTPSQRVQGQANVELLLVPAFELRQITVTVALAAQ